MKHHLVMVYGTLCKGGTNHHFLEHEKRVADQAWINGSLYDTGYGYPAVKLGGTERVHGEVYEVDEAVLAQLDALEGYLGEGKDNLYDRSQVKVTTEQEELDAFVYTAGRQFINLKLIKDGDWRVYSVK